MSENCPQCGSVMIAYPVISGWRFRTVPGTDPSGITVYVCPYGHTVKWRRQGDPFVTSISSQAYYEDALERFHKLHAKREALSSGGDDTPLRR